MASDVAPDSAGDTGGGAGRGGIHLPDGLRHRYGRNGFELRLPELAIPAGAQAVCIGPSGSGKTTLLHLLSGILVPEEGRVLVAGEDLTAMDEAGRRRFRMGRVGLVFQEFELLEHLSVRDNILLPYLLDPALAATGRPVERLATLAAATGVTDKLERKPRQLSQGERQRVAICRALITEPAVVLADEPTGNLDPVNTGRALDLMLAVAADRGATVLVVTHDHSVLDRFDQVVDLGILAGGAAQGATEGATP